MTLDLFRITRCVVLPDFQGLGLVNIMNEYIGELYFKNKKRLSIVTTHPGLVRSYCKSSKWKLTNYNNGIKKEINFDTIKLNTRLKASFIYLPIRYIKGEWEI